MKRLLYLIIPILLTACSKDNRLDSPENYVPKNGDSLEILLKMWGNPDSKVLTSPSFNDDANYFYLPPKNKKVTIKNKVVTDVQAYK